MTDTNTHRLISPDQLKSWSRCKKQFYYKAEQKIRWPSDPANFSLGRDVHKLMDYAAKGLEIALLRDAAPGNVVTCYNKLAEDAVAQLPVVASEWGFNIPVALAEETVWLTGRIDRIAQDGDRILIIDWKTGTAIPRQPETDWQTIVYSWAVMQAARQLGLENLEPDQLSFVYVGADDKPDTPVRHVRVPYDTTRHQAADLSLRETLHGIINESVYALPAKCPDRFCPFDNICGIKSLTAGNSETPPNGSGTANILDSIPNN